MIERVDLAVEIGACIGNKFNSMVPHLWFREFIEVVFVKQIFEVSAPVWDYFLERLGPLFCICFGREVIGMMSAYVDGLRKVYCENGFPFFQLFVPLVIRISVGKDKWSFVALASGEHHFSGDTLEKRSRV